MKSTLASDKIKYTFDSISSDDIRSEETNRLLSKSNISREQAFEKSRVAANKYYKQDLTSLIRNTSNLKPGAHHIIFLDKNHPPNGGIQGVTQLIDNEIPKGIQYQTLYMIPTRKNETILDFPFSYEFVAQNLHNGLNRDKHDTLDNSNIPKLFAISLMFLNMNKK